MSSSIQRARDACNKLLSAWKNEIGELEKPKEVEAAKRAEERRKAAAEAKRNAGNEDEDDSEEEEGDE